MDKKQKTFRFQKAILLPQKICLFPVNPMERHGKKKIPRR